MMMANSTISYSAITVTDVVEIDACKKLNDKNTANYYREISITDESGSHITLRLYSKRSGCLDVIDKEKS